MVLARLARLRSKPYRFKMAAKRLYAAIHKGWQGTPGTSTPKKCRAPKPQDVLSTGIGKGRCIGRNDSGTAPKKGYSGSTRRDKRLLQPGLPHPKEIRRVETHYRSLPLKSVSGGSNFYNGHHNPDPKSSETGHVGYVDRSIGRVPPHSDRSRILEVPLFRNQRQSVPIYGSALRASASPIRFLQDNGDFESMGEAQRHVGLPVSGRLVHSPYQSVNSNRANAKLGQESDAGRPVSKHEKVQSNAQPERGLSGRKMGLTDSNSLSNGRPAKADRRIADRVSTTEQSKYFSHGKFTRSLGRLRKDGAVGQIAPTGSSVSGKESSQVRTKPLELLLPAGKNYAGTGVVEGCGNQETGPSFPCTHSSGNHPNGRLQIGLGAHLDGILKTGKWDKAEAKSHINWLEMKAVWLTLHAFLPRLKGKVVQWQIDNSTTVAYLANQGGTKSAALLQLTGRILRMAFQHQVTILPVHLKGELNVLADLASRRGLVVQTEWCLARPAFHQVSEWSPWDPPELDLFANALTKQISRYFSPCPDPDAMGLDALSIDWPREVLYAFPPFNLVDKVLEKALRSRPLRLILIAPDKPDSKWYPLLGNFQIQSHKELPLLRDLLFQPHWTYVHPTPQLLQLHVWFLSLPV